MFSCDWCGESFTQKCHVNRHIISVHEKKEYKCDQCDYTVNRKDNLARHMKKHMKRRSADAPAINSDSKYKKRRIDEVNWGEGDLSSMEIDNLIPIPIVESEKEKGEYWDEGDV